MATWVWIAIAIAAVIAVALAAGMALMRRRTAALRQHFGAEYDRTVRSREDRRAAEADLRARQRHRARLTIKPLPEPTRIRFTGEWRGVQEGFVDHPRQAVTAADSLVKRVMEARGYPYGDFEELASLVSVDHPEAVENYRLAHGVRERAAMQRASTEDLRQAMLLYRSLFHELIQPDGAEISNIAERANAGAAIAGPGTAGRRTGAIAVPAPRAPIAVPAGPSAVGATRPRTAGTGTAGPGTAGAGTGAAGPGTGAGGARESAAGTANGGAVSARSENGASSGNGATPAPRADGAAASAGEAEDAGSATRTSRWARISRRAGVDDEQR